ncbi:DUF418 domain-containing protein [Thermocatellispora tengchongensis]|nr:DUF418 domain-containing protein [Thermocatellispora tengchongensis]
MAEKERIHELDAVRGLALCGIMVVNTWQHTRGRLGNAPHVGVDWVIESLLQARFYPIFSFLFGIGLVLFLRSADRIRLVWRLVILAGFGCLHQLLVPGGEVLLPYAVIGLVVLLPASFLPRLAVLILGVLATAFGCWKGGGYWVIPGLFLLGMAMMQYRPPREVVPPVFVASALGGGLLTWLTVYMRLNPGELWIAAVPPVAGLLDALAYATGLLLLLRTRLRRPLLAVLAPLGRMALTNYLTSTPVILAALPLLTADPTRRAGIVLSVITLAVQVLFSRWWLSRFDYGPAEWLWRRLTWNAPVPNRVEK